MLHKWYRLVHRQEVLGTVLKVRQGLVELVEKECGESDDAVWERAEKAVEVKCLWRKRRVPDWQGAIVERGPGSEIEYLCYNLARRDHS